MTDSGNDKDTMLSKDPGRHGAIFSDKDQEVGKLRNYIRIDKELVEIKKILVNKGAAGIESWLLACKNDFKTKYAGSYSWYCLGIYPA